MDLPLFPLKLVFFPGQVIPLHIFEPRYREMINFCIETESPFGIVLIKEGEAEGDTDTVPYEIGTAAKILGVERLEDGRMNVTVVGTKRFRVNHLDYSKNYLSGDVNHYPVINGGTQRAQQLAQQVRPKVIEYVNAISDASKSQLPLDKLPEDPTSLAFLVAMAMPFPNDEKQRLLGLPGIPELLARENYLLWREVSILHHMLKTQMEIVAQTTGPTGYIFPN
ncbi:LON peptidase substrate-binding domain-containing protein [Chloroflexi bacterium TSY]|nr:LON peptidase substrate-binding domain-containing protein [Chloroflexi bacterium TSY]